MNGIKSDFWACQLWEKKLKFRQIKKMDITPPDVVNHYVT